MGPLGLIAGEGVFPLLVARGARAAGRKVVCAAFSGHAWPDLSSEVDRMEWVGLLRFGQWIRVLRSEGCEEAVMVGNSPKSDINPPLEIGMWAVFIPHDHTWQLEHQEIDRMHERLLVLDRFVDLIEHF